MSCSSLGLSDSSGSRGWLAVSLGPADMAKPIASCGGGRVRDEEVNLRDVWVFVTTAS